MMDLWLCPDQVFDGQTLRDDLAVGITADKVTDVVPKSTVDPACCHRLQGVVTPGFVDLQVNGGGGVLFNQNPTVAGMNTIAAAHRGLGTVAIMPTLITDAPDVMDHAAAAAIAANDYGFFAGLHIEGPHIAPIKRGTHAARFIRPLDRRTIDVVLNLRAHGVAVMLTLAPEAATLDQIAELVDRGVIVSLGHSDASSTQAIAAFDAGAQCVTHLFNAMSQMQGRAPGLAGAAINSDACAGFICDGVHVSDDMLQLAIRARPVPDRMFLVSDAMPTVGGPDRFHLYGDDIWLDQGRLINAEGNLAGAHVSQAQGVARLVQHVGVTLDTALRMAITVPAGLVGAPHLCQLVGREISDVILLDDQLKFQGAITNHLG